MKKLVVIDSHALIHRAFHALPMLTAPDGRPTNAVYGFTSILLKMLADLKPDYVVAAMDLAGPTFRHEEFKEYKAQREKAPDELYAQIPLAEEMLGTLGIPVVSQKGYEADDIIGTLADQGATVPDLQTVIMTGDLDTLQLVQGKTVVVLTLRKGVTDVVTYDEAAVRDRYGLGPEQVADFKGLKGDPSDNIPGVRGIGEKTAAALIQQFGTLERLYEELEKPATGRKKKQGSMSESVRAKLEAGRESALFSKKLATIVRNVPVTLDLTAADWRARMDQAAVEAKCREFGFYSLAKRLPAVLGKAAAQAPTLDFDAPITPSVPITEASEPSDLPSGTQLVLQPEIEHLEIRTLLASVDGEVLFSLADPTPERCQEAVGPRNTLIGHDLKALVRVLPEPAALADKTLHDTMVGAWLVNPELRDYSLERVAYDIASLPLGADRSTWPAAIVRLDGLIQERLQALELTGIYRDIEMPLIPVLATMEQTGIRVDTTKIGDLLKVAQESVANLEQEIWKLAGGEFNINSPAQLAEILFTTLAIKGRIRRTGKGAPSTAAPELEKLREEHPIIDLVLQYRELSKLKTTYIEPFPSLVASDGRIHTTYHQAGTATGRLSSSNPNLQNVPTRTELGQRFRAAFTADPGWKLVSLDYSQLELRIVAHMADDETMIQAFRTGEDIHTRTASAVFGAAPEAVTKDMRRQAKVLNFGLIYGMGSQGFARAAKIGQSEAKRFIQEYFARFPGVAAYMERTKREAYERGFVSTLLGRRRPLADITSRIPQLAAAAERMAINHPIQGTGADLVKLAMLAVDQLIRREGLQDRVRLLLQVHDELVMEVRTPDVPAITEKIRELMEQIHELKVPLVVDAKVGDNWSDMEPIKHA